MALRVLMAKKKLDEAKKELENQRSKMADFLVREADLEKAIEEASTDEEKAVVEEEVNKFETEKADAEAKEKSLGEEVEKLEGELAEIEKEQETPEPENEEKHDEPKVAREERGIKTSMNKRDLFANMSIEERTAFFENDGVKNWLGNIRSAKMEQRAINNVGLTIPEVVLPLLRQNISNWSKLYDRVMLKYVSGEARQNILGDIPEAIWTECCANLNELTMTFNDWSVDCFKVGGYFAVCNANLSDSDYDLANEVISAIGQAIGKALDKAIDYGRNIAANSKMPLGIVTSLLQESQPADYPATARAWADLHTTHVISIGTAQAPVSGLNLFKQLVIASGIVTTDYSRGNILWQMNDKTYKALVAESLSINAAGGIVAGVNGTMPVVGGDVEVMNFLPDNVIIFGYMDLYLLAERGGRQFASSEHVRFLQDQTVYKGTARYDGAPIIREAFGIIALNGATVSATAVTFPQDTANTGA